VTPTELLLRLAHTALSAPSGSATARIIQSFDCFHCGRPTRLVAVQRTQAEFACLSCLLEWAIEIPPT
jgi:hypothetical protein